MAKTKDTIESNIEVANEYAFNAKEHIHTYLGKPLMGTSTVVGVIAKPLTWWASGLACEKLGWINGKKRIDGKYTTIPLDKRIIAVEPTLAKIKEMGAEEYISLLDEAYKAHSVKLDKSADAGTDLHAELERYVKNTMENRMATYDEKIQPFIDWALANVKKFIYSEMYCYSNTLWVGGISDCAVELNDGKVGIIDFKSSKESYESQFIQIAGYDLQISENGGFNEQGYPIFKLEKPIDFYAVVPFGSEKFTVDMRYNVGELKEGFKSAVVLWKLTNK